MKYIVKNHSDRILLARLCVKNKFVIFHSFTIPKLNLIFYKVIFNTILISNIFPSSSKAAPSHINNIQFKVLIRSSVQN